MGKLLALVYVVGIHVEFNLSKPRCSFVLCGISGVMMLWLRRGTLTRRAAYAMLAVNAVVAASIFPSPGRVEFWMEGVKSYAQLTYSMVSALGLYLEVATWDARAACRYAGIGVVILVIGMAVEVYVTPVRAVSDAFRVAIAAKGVFLYGQDSGGGEFAVERDLAMAGHARPNFFAREPSYLAYTTVLLILPWYRLSRSNRAIPAFLVAFAVGVKMSGSPTMMGAGVVAVATWLDDLLVPGRWPLRWRLAPALIVLPVAVVLPTIFGDRFSPGKADMSTLLRVSLPYQFAGKSLAEHPGYGIGIGMLEVYEDDIVVEATNLAVGLGLDPDILEGCVLSAVLVNSFAEIPLYFGVIGGLAFLVAVGAVVRVLGAGRYVFVATVMFGVANTFGGMVTCRFWTLLLVCCVSARLSRRQTHARKSGRSPVRVHTDLDRVDDGCTVASGSGQA